MFSESIDFIKSLYPGKSEISLHEPLLQGNEKRYVNEAIDSTFVSSVGEFVTRFESDFCKYSGAQHAVAAANGTLALHTALHLLDVKPGDEVITQALSFVATANAISYCHATPVFIDSDPANLGMSVESLETFLSENTQMQGDKCINKKTNRQIKACVPMHVFGHPVNIEAVVAVCSGYMIPVIEDAAEALGSYYRGTHTGLFGKIGVFSFNGNKIVTAGGGGMLVTADAELAKRAKHITTTAKIPHRWNFSHDELGFNYRMPNLNAALACAQLEKIEEFVVNKRQTAAAYAEHFHKMGIRFQTEPKECRSNYWLNAIFLKDRSQRDLFLEQSHSVGVRTRPVWELLPTLPMYQGCQSVDLKNAQGIANCLVNLPSSVRSI